MQPTLTKKNKSFFKCTEETCVSCELLNQGPSIKETIGSGRLKCLIVAENPRSFDTHPRTSSKIFSSSSGLAFRDILRTLPVSLSVEDDFWCTYAVCCRAADKKNANRELKDKEIFKCSNFLWDKINTLKPRHIWLFGAAAIRAFIGHEFKTHTADRWRGLCIPDRRTGAWVTMFPEVPSLSEHSNDKNFLSCFVRDMLRAYHNLSREPFEFEEEKVHILTDYSAVYTSLNDILSNGSPVTIDFETNCMRPYKENAKILTVSFTQEDYSFAFPFDHKDATWSNEQFDKILELIEAILTSEIPKIGHNIKYEDEWARVVLNCPIKNWMWDTMLAAHVEDNRREYCGLNFLTYSKFGRLPYDEYIDKYKKATTDDGYNRMEEADMHKLLEYNALDTKFTSYLFELQKDDKNIDSEAVNLLIDGTLALTKVQINGIFTDVKYYTQQDRLLGNTIAKLEKELDESKEAALFFQKNNRNINWGSSKDLSELYFSILGEKGTLTEKGNYRTDKKTLEELDLPINKKLLEVRKLEKIKNTYLSGFLGITDIHGYLHPSFDLVIPITYRSSSSDPNFQNVPVRDEYAKAVTRGGIMPSRGNLLLEADIKGAEVCLSACYHHDPAMINYILDSNNDMHRDVACDMLKCTAEWFKENFDKKTYKDIRFYAKNDWTFAQFYGDYFKKCCPNFWEHVRNLKLKDGRTVQEYWRETGIRSYKEFENHGKDVEDIFWQKRFRVYNKWRYDVVEFYQRYGYVDTYFGFKYRGYIQRNKICNYPIQGTAFLCLLWMLIRLIDIAERENWKSKVIGQIHDSILIDVYPKELEHVQDTLKQIALDIRIENPWIIVPLTLEFEATAINKPWSEKKEI